MSKEKLMNKVMAILRERGRKTLQVARNAVLQEEVEFRSLRESLHYFIILGMMFYIQL